MSSIKALAVLMTATVQTKCHFNVYAPFHHSGDFAGVTTTLKDDMFRISYNGDATVSMYISQSNEIKPLDENYHNATYSNALC